MAEVRYKNTSSSFSKAKPSTKGIKMVDGSRGGEMIKKSPSGGMGFPNTMKRNTKKAPRGGRILG